MGFTRAREALDHLKDHPADLAILDINMPDIDGIALAIRLKQTHPKTAVLFLTAYQEYVFDAFSVHPTGYMLKPVPLEELATEIQSAFADEKPVRRPSVQARTFGEFDLRVGRNTWM